MKTKARLETLQFTGGLMMFAALMFMWGSAESSVGLGELLIKVIASIALLFVGTALYSYAKEHLAHPIRPQVRMANIVLDREPNNTPDGLVIGFKK